MLRVVFSDTDKLFSCAWQDFMERPLDVGNTDIDVEGFAQIIVGEDHK